MTQLQETENRTSPAATTWAAEFLLQANFESGVLAFHIDARPRARARAGVLLLQLHGICIPTSHVSANGAVQSVDDMPGASFYY